MKFTVELKPPLENGTYAEIEIYLDREGLASLSGQLGFLRDGKTSAIHLMTPSWGLHHLTEEKMGPENELIHHVMISLQN